jgi:hypothetical protein
VLEALQFKLRQPLRQHGSQAQASSSSALSAGVVFSAATMEAISEDLALPLHAEPVAFSLAEPVNFSLAGGRA